MWVLYCKQSLTQLRSAIIKDLQVTLLSEVTDLVSDELVVFFRCRIELC